MLYPHDKMMYFETERFGYIIGTPRPPLIKIHIPQGIPSFKSLPLTIQGANAPEGLGEKQLRGFKGSWPEKLFNSTTVVCLAVASSVLSLHLARSPAPRALTRGSEPIGYLRLTKL